MLLSLGSFVAAFVLSLFFYQGLATLLSDRLGWSPVWTKPAAFITLWVLIELVFSTIGRLVSRGLGHETHNSAPNKVLAVVPGALQGLLFAALLLTMLALMPMQGEARRTIVKSPIGGRLVTATLALERPLEGIFGPAARETLGFITVRPPAQGGTATPSEGIQLNFTVDDAPPEPQTEEAMLALVNEERTSRGLVPLEMDAELRLVARAHAADMFARGYFAHDTPDGVDPFERMRAANIVFGLAGENLALAPTVEIAHDGLMNSPGHRANILNEGFRRVGIGVLDGGVFGKMFVQEFTD
jgi:uncharacterized protein YkwD/uncharacterized membrane protein required for colicin V production